MFSLRQRFSDRWLAEVCTKSFECVCVYDRHMCPEAILHRAPSLGPLSSANVYQSSAASGLSPRRTESSTKQKGLGFTSSVWGNINSQVQYYLPRQERWGCFYVTESVQRRISFEGRRHFWNSLIWQVEKCVCVWVKSMTLITLERQETLLTLCILCVTSSIILSPLIKKWIYHYTAWGTHKSGR